MASLNAIFIGFTIDTKLMRISIPVNSVNLLLAALAEIVPPISAKNPRITRIPLKKFQSVVGHLVWVSQVIPPARVYLSEMFNTMSSVAKFNWKHVNVSSALRYDFLWFRDTLLDWNGISLISTSEWETNSHIGFTSDSCLTGAGFISTRSFSFWSWCPESADRLGIQGLELLTVCIGLYSYGSLLSSRRILWATDNESNIQSFSKGRCVNPFVTDILRDIISAEIRFSLEIRLLHVFRENIQGADDLSKGKISEFISRFPHKLLRKPILPSNCSIGSHGKVCFKCKHC